MNFEYYFDNENDWLHIHILPNDLIKGDIFMVEAWLEGDIQGGSYELELFKELIENPEKKEEKFWGNSMIVNLVKGGNSTIEWCFYDESPNSCTLPTEMLYEILKIWVAKKEELRAEKEKDKSNKN